MQVPTLAGLEELADRITALRDDAAHLKARKGSGAPEVRRANQLLRRLMEERRVVALTLLRHGADELEVMRTAGVSWKVLAAWCAADPDPPLASWSFIELQAEEARAKRLTEKRRSERHKDATYCHNLEHLNDLKTEYRLLEGRPCVPFTQESSDEIDELQGLLDEWFTVQPQVWTEAEFIAAHQKTDVTELATSMDEPWIHLDDDELEFDPDDLF